MTIATRDYAFNKLCFDVQRDKALSDQLRVDPTALIARYELKPPIVAAIERRDPGYLSTLSNPVLLRYFFYFLGVSEADFVARLRAHHAASAGETGNG